MVRDDFAVNQSRVFTLQGGDILIWSSEGDIDAGKGAKTAATTPPPQIIVRGDQIILDTSNSVSGSGIGVLLGKDGIEPGSVDLIAPKGAVIAGDAGIRALGDVFIPGKVIGADNIQAGGSKVGSLQVDVASAPAAPAAPAAAATGEGAAQQAGEAARSGSDRQNSLFTVEVIGLGDEDEEEKRRKRN
ncbi:MAG: filamentous hemagglutinin family protein [Alphaproteobacteria bacterium]|nr:filamentous hemagglutinin family protein [Alphaproteobacteria bacterium]